MECLTPVNYVVALVGSREVYSGALVWENREAGGSPARAHRCDGDSLSTMSLAKAGKTGRGDEP